VTLERLRTITHLQFNCIDAAIPPELIKVLLQLFNMMIELI
jgi:hypothetical protein